MSGNRQLPLFEPLTAEDLNARTALKYTVPFFHEYLLKEGKSEHTVRAFNADLLLLAEHAGDDTPIGEFTTDMLNQFLHWLENGRGVPCSRKSYARRVTTLKVYFKWLYGLKAIALDPAKAVLQRSGPAPLARILSPQEIDEALSFAAQLKRSEKPDTRPEVLFRLLMTTGIKKAETVALKREHIDRTSLAHPVLLIKHKVRNVYKERRIALDAQWVVLLDEYLAQYNPRHDLIFDCTARNLEYVLSDLAAGAGLPKISFEMMRWTCAVQDYVAGMEPEAIRDKLGLSDASWVETHSKIKRLIEQRHTNDRY